MTDKEKNYFVPEQMDDEDFEKEKIEEKQARKERKFEFNKKQCIRLVSILLFIVLIVVGVYLYLNPIQEKATAPEQAAKEFCAYFNSRNWSKVNNMMDLKGYYILGGVLEEADYTKFNNVYDKLDEDDSDYEKFIDTIKVLMNIDQDLLDSVADFQIKIENVEACNLIQGTESLYKLRVNFSYKYYDGQEKSLVGIVYMSNASGEYKMVFGDWIQTVLNFYQSIYIMQANYGY